MVDSFHLLVAADPGARIIGNVVAEVSPPVGDTHSPHDRHQAPTPSLRAPWLPPAVRRPRSSRDASGPRGASGAAATMRGVRPGAEVRG